MIIRSPQVSLLLCGGQMSRRLMLFRLHIGPSTQLHQLLSPSCLPTKPLRVADINQQTIESKLMESSLHEAWESASGNPFVPLIGKDSQLFVGFTLLTIGLLLSGLFGLSKYMCRGSRNPMLNILQTVPSSTFPSLEFQLRWPLRTSQVPQLLAKS